MFAVSQFRRSTAFLLWLLAFSPIALNAQTKEYQVKAAFLFNFAQFVEWPESIFPSPDAPFSIGILGDDPFGQALEDAVRGESIGGHKMNVKRSKHVADLKDCQMIFVSKSEKSHIGEILAAIGSRPVLLVGDVPGFARNGGDVNFFLEGSKVRFEINPDAAQSCGLRFNSQLLALGRIVATAKEGK